MKEKNVRTLENTLLDTLVAAVESLWRAFRCYLEQKEATATCRKNDIEKKPAVQMGQNKFGSKKKIILKTSGTSLNHFDQFFET